ncbi:MAG: hypothetical protein L6R42_007570 [Xanthoria sp. 1 TBL-2021]|nr:MAG: hypothetical protein L6R42_007570 [Xanthoria sp. 1 TBL-2021]
METTSEIENAPAGLKLDQIQARYGQIQEELHAGGVDSMAYTIEQRFGHQLAKSRAPEQMAGCVCINFGSFTSPKYEELCKQKNRPMFHLAAFELFKKQLGKIAHVANF